MNNLFVILVLVMRMMLSLGYGLCVQFKSYHLHTLRNTVPSSAVFEKDLANAVLRTKTIVGFGISCLIRRETIERKYNEQHHLQRWEDINQPGFLQV
jgi:hypothetical protein